MNKKCNFNKSTEKYLNEFYEILDEMIYGMTHAQTGDSISYNFIVQMIPHHLAAIAMSENILQYTNNERLISIAESIIKEQTKSIANMQEIMDSCENCCNSPQELCNYQYKLNNIMENMFYQMDFSRASNNLNCSFMWEMIPHHRGAVRMSETTLQYRICPKLRPILRAIITSQKRGIVQMQELLKCINCCR